MRKNWVSLAGFLALTISQTGVYSYGDDASPTPVTAAESVPAPLGVTANKLDASAAESISPTTDSDALGFWAVGSDGSPVNAARTTVRVVRSGRIVQARRVGEGGVAQISQVSSGPYSIMASGPEGFAAFGAYLGDPAGPLMSRVGLVPQRDAQVVRGLIRSHLAEGATSESTASNKGASQTSTDKNGSFEVQADGTVDGQIIRATADGQDIQPISNMFVAFVRDGQVVSETSSDANGDFSASGMSSGIYSLVLAGPSGFAAYSTEVITAHANAQGRVKRIQFVAFQAGKRTTVIPASREDSGFLNQSPNPNGPENGPPGLAGLGGPGFGGGSGAGGGAAGGGGLGGGGLLGAALGAAAGILGSELANDDDNPPATPAVP